MDKFSGTGAKQLLEEFGIQKEVKPSVKHYVDTYYDLDLSTDTKKDDSLPLLDNKIVFRHRSVPKSLNSGEVDPEGTNLIAIKGRSVEDKGEAIRLAAQFQAQYDLLRDDKMAEVLSFLRSQQVDNPFARILQDALGDQNAELLRKATGVKKALTVTSKRTKYKLWLVNTTMIDLSVDEARGEMDGYPKRNDDVVYSFEVGVGHPGLSTGSTGTCGLSEEDPRLLQLQKELEDIPDESLGPKTIKLDTIKRRQQKTSTLVHRPYHVPEDLNNPRLFEKDDYKQYMNLRDDLINRLFGMDKTQLGRGGNKAKLLADKIKTVKAQ